MNAIRSRWAAIGSAVAVALGAGGLGIATAATSGAPNPVFTAINPCRLMDTRPEFQVGDRATPLGADETYDVVVHGSTGNCSDIPAEALAVGLNVTAVEATAPTFLTFWPTGAVQPGTSNLNPVPGLPPTPNAVTVDLSTNGSFSIYNLAGTVDVVVDLVGFYVDHDHDDRYYTKSQVDADIANATETAPWEVDISPTDLVPNGAGWPSMLALGGAQAAAGMAFDPDASGTVFVSFTLPADYVPGTDVEVELALSAIGGFGAPTFPCDSVWRMGSVRAARFGTSTFDIEPVWDDPFGADDFTRILWSERQFDGREVSGARLSLDGRGLAPGSQLTTTLVRFGSDANDTCRGMMIVGMSVRAAN